MRHVPDLRSAVQHAMLETPAAVDSVAKYSKPLAKALETTNVMSRGHQVSLHETARPSHRSQVSACLLVRKHRSLGSFSLNAAGMAVCCLVWDMSGPLQHMLTCLPQANCTERAASSAKHCRHMCPSCLLSASVSQRLLSSEVLVQPEFYEDRFQEQWTTLQRKSKLLAFQVASETINNLSSKLWYIIFVR